MANIFNEDFRDFLNALNTQQVKYILVGGYSVIIHGYSRTNWDVFTFGNPPVAIDLMVKLKGLEFADCYMKSIVFDDDGLKIRTIHKSDLIEAKKFSGRSKDLNDIENLQ